MKLLHGTAVFLLTVFAYSAGHATVIRRRQVVPRGSDVVLGPMTAAALLYRSLSFPIWIGLMLAVVGGFLVGFAVRAMSHLLMNSDGEGDLYCSGEVEGARGWRLFLFRVGNFQGRLILAMVYFLLVPPFALVVRIGQDPLSLRERLEESTSFWRTVDESRSSDGLSKPY